MFKLRVLICFALKKWHEINNNEIPSICGMEDWLNLENEFLTTPQMSDEQILATVVSDVEDDVRDEKQVSNSEAIESFKKCLSWMGSQSNIDPFHSGK